MPRTKGRVEIGTSGWHYPEFKGLFYPEALRPECMLDFYAKRFCSAEVNNSFYRLPERAIFERWRQATPKGFVFSVKGSRFLTHMKKLKDPKPAVDLFFSRAEGLKDKLGPVLFQLPPRWRLNLERLRGFLEVLPGRHRYAIEFRDPTWLVPEVDRLLEEHHVAFCIYDLAGFLSPLKVTADFVYVRLHGPGKGKYQGSYRGKRLAEWAERIVRWRDEGRDVYVYFDNTAEGAAVTDALELKRVLEEARNDSAHRPASKASGWAA